MLIGIGLFIIGFFLFVRVIIKTKKNDDNDDGSLLYGLTSMSNNLRGFVDFFWYIMIMLIGAILLVKGILGEDIVWNFIK